ncbi:kinase-like protein [Ceratobasidium sp. AG-I]|nr:kinase-like protein [Ceratobasidium sp. AG-I]
MGFFITYPWLSASFKITSTTPLERILAYFRNLANVRVMTSALANAQEITSQPVAHGGLADIYRVTLVDGSQVAVKRLRQRPESGNKALKRTARELNTWAKLNHPNILKLLGLAELHEMLSMVSPWMECGNVVSAVKNRPTLDRFLLCAQLTDVVAYLHGAGVIHGDLKGENVLLDGGGNIKLTDFGLSIMHEQAMQFSETDPGGGTMRWMAPELLDETTGRCQEADVYAMGMTMMEIITGRIPFSEIKRGPGVIKAVTRDRRIPEVPELRTEPQSRRAALMLSVLLRCWAYKPRKRVTAEEAKTLMEQLSSH